MDNITILKKYSLNYLSKYNTSKNNLNKILRNKIRKMNLEKKEKIILDKKIVEIIADLEVKKFINDKDYAQSKMNFFSLQGKSKNFIKYYLIQKGIEKDIIEETFSDFEIKNPEWEIESAKIFARKKILNKKSTNSVEKDLAKMARAGFDYKIIKAILEIH